MEYRLSQRHLHCHAPRSSAASCRRHGHRGRELPRPRERTGSHSSPQEEKVMNLISQPAQHATVLPLAQLIEQPLPPMPCLIEPGLLPAQGILFVGGEPKLGKSVLVANLALSLAAGSNRVGF